MLQIGKAAVLGAGTMGAAIAAHLSNAGIPTLLLDIAPRELSEDEQKKGTAHPSGDVVLCRIVQTADCEERVPKRQKLQGITLRRGR